jgi:ketosteroid isomerase-like protein
MPFKPSQLAFLAVLAVLFLYATISCVAQPAIDKIPAHNPGDVLIQVDRNFAKMAIDRGTAYAFSYFAADSATILQRGSRPTVGRSAIRDLYKDEGNSTLRWEPYFADLAASGDIGYTLGNYQYSYKDSTGTDKRSYGYYVTIWKKQPDGNWKYVLDTGVSAPPPKPDSATSH